MSTWRQRRFSRQCAEAYNGKAPVSGIEFVFHGNKIAIECTWTAQPEQLQLGPTALGLTATQIYKLVMHYTGVYCDTSCIDSSTHRCKLYKRDWQESDLGTQSSYYLNIATACWVMLLNAVYLIYYSNNLCAWLLIEATSQPTLNSGSITATCTISELGRRC